MKKIGNILGLDLYLPNNYGRGSEPKEYIDPYYLLVKEVAKDYISIETPEGIHRITDAEQLISLFTHETNYISTPTLDIFLKWSTTKTILSVLPPFSYGSFPCGSHTIKYYPNTNHLKIDNKQNVIRINPYIFKTFPIKTLDDIKFVVNKLDTLKEMGIDFNPISPAATASTTFINTVDPKVFNIMYYLTEEDISLIMNSYYSLRQENAYIGFYPFMKSIDMKKAYLNILSNQYSYAKSENKLIRATKNLTYCHTGWFEIITSNPETKFPLFPYKTPEGKVTYPIGGPFKTTVHKSRLDLADLLEIPYEITKSIQLATTSGRKPFKELTYALWNIIEDRTEELYPLNLKTLYFSIIGHMMHYHEAMVMDDRSRIYVTSADFHPLIASTVAATVDSEVYKLMYNSINPYFISADGGGAENFMSIPDTFKLLGEGTGISFDPSLKDKPGKTPTDNIGLVENLIKKYRDKTSIKIKLPYINTSTNSWSKPLSLGMLSWKNIERAPNCGTRHLIKSPKKIGYLLDRLFISKPPIILSSGIVNYIPEENWSPQENNLFMEIANE